MHIRQSTKTQPAQSSSPRFGLLAATMIASVLALSACNTMSGIGEDTQAAGRALENTAEDAQR